MAQRILVRGFRPTDPPIDPLDKVAIVIALIIILRLVGGC